MGEYIKYKGAEVKIGTLDNLYYTSYQKYQQALKEGQLVGLEGNGLPEDYVNPDLGFRFRFPFPDEDKFPFGDIGKFPYDRGVPVKIIAKDVNTQQEWQFIAGQKSQLEITQQKLIHREHDNKLVLSLIVRNPDSGLSLRIEDDHVIKQIVKSIIHNHLVRAANPEERIFIVKWPRGLLRGISWRKQ